MRGRPQAWDDGARRFYRLQGTAIGFRQAAYVVTGIIAEIEHDVRRGVLDRKIATHLIHYLDRAVRLILALTCEVDASLTHQDGRLQGAGVSLDTSSLVPTDRGKTEILDRRSAISKPKL